MRTRFILFLALFIAAVSLTAQVAVGPEVTTDPIAKFGGYSLVPDGDGFLYAWSENGRIRLTRLDATLHNAATPIDLPADVPAVGAGAIAVSPSVARNGSSIVVAWHASALGTRDATAVVRVAPDAARVIGEPQFVVYSTSAPAVYTALGLTAVRIANDIYWLRDDLSIATIAPLPPDASVTFNGSEGGVAQTSRTTTTVFYVGPCSGGRSLQSCESKLSRTVASITLIALPFARNDQYVYGTADPGAPGLTHDAIVAVDGEGFAGAWVMTDGLHILPFARTGAGAERFVRGFLASELALSGNGSDIVVVSGSGELSATVLHADGTTTPPVSLGPGRNPRIVQVTATAFAVTYERPMTDGTIVVGRIIRVGPVRGRAVR